MSAPLRILISAGEVSGDLYAAQLVCALRREAGADAMLHIQAVAGERTRRAGAELLADSASRAALGFVAPVRHLPSALATALRVLRLLRRWRPQVVVLLDYPGFNIPLSSMIRRFSAVPIVYYLPPEECLWGLKGSGRVNRTAQVVRNCDCLLTTHATDTAFYSTAGGTVRRMGHPLLDLVDPDGIGQRGTVVGREATVALLPASRCQELSLLWPALAQAAAIMVRASPGLNFLVPLAAGHLRPGLVQASEAAQRHYPELAGRLRLVEPTPECPNAALAAARRVGAALSKSGSVTLELALAGVPHLMAFRIDRITEWLGRRFLRLSERDFPHMALPNFILGRELVPEFKQHAIDPARMADTGLELLNPASPVRAAQLAGFAELRLALGGAGAAGRGARIILELATRHCGLSSNLRSQPRTGAGASSLCRDGNPGPGILAGGEGALCHACCSRDRRCGRSVLRVFPGSPAASCCCGPVHGGRAYRLCLGRELCCNAAHASAFRRRREHRQAN